QARRRVSSATRTRCSSTASCTARAGTIPAPRALRWWTASTAPVYQVTRDAAFVCVAKPTPQRIDAWAKNRGWTPIDLVSDHCNSYQADYLCQGGGDDMQ